jgi:uncharacterized membrane protein YhaH (DUF805 family)
MHWYAEVMRKYAVFGGRARRKEYWMFQLFNFIIVVGLVCICALLIPLLAHGDSSFGAVAWLVIPLGYVLATLLPGLAVSVRRLHDTNLSGWWVFLALVPLGGVALFVMHLLDSTPGHNRYGPNPKGVTAAALVTHYGTREISAAAGAGPVQESGQWFLGFCNTCGTQMQAGARFCPKCGKTAY